MGTKNNPGPFDCYAKADPDEPIFVLRAKDPLAPALVRLWAHVRRVYDQANGPITPGDSDKYYEANQCADQMENWREKQTEMLRRKLEANSQYGKKEPVSAYPENLTRLSMNVQSQLWQFVNKILHGNNDHKAWLLESCQAFIDGKEIPKVPVTENPEICHVCGSKPHSPQLQTPAQRGETLCVCGCMQNRHNILQDFGPVQAGGKPGPAQPPRYIHCKDCGCPVFQRPNM